LNLGILNHQFIFISYPFGAGGTHIQNLMSLDPDCYPKGSLDHSTFYNELLDLYSNSNNVWAHYSNHLIFNDEKELIESIKKIDDTLYKKSVHTGHCYSYLASKNFLEKLSSIKIIIISAHDQETKKLLKQRQSRILGKDYIDKTDTMVQYTEDLLYSRDFFQDFYNVKSQDLIEIEGSLLYQTDITEILLAMNLEFEMNIPLDKALILHNLWLKNIVK